MSEISDYCASAPLKEEEIVAWDNHAREVMNQPVCSGWERTLATRLMRVIQCRYVPLVRMPTAKQLVIALYEFGVDRPLIASTLGLPHQFVEAILREEGHYAIKTDDI